MRRQALEKLADHLPTLQQRERQAMREVAQLRQKQDEVARQAELARDTKSPEKANQMLQEAARKQAEIAEALGKVDAPNREERQERVQDAANRALADLMDGRKQDVPASQQEAKRELARLEQLSAARSRTTRRPGSWPSNSGKLAEEANKAAQNPEAIRARRRNCSASSSRWPRPPGT